MATGDTANFAARLRGLLPARWFGDADPLLSGLLGGMGASWASLYALLGFTAQQTRIATMSGPFLDLTSADFFGAVLPRKPGESDDGYRARIKSQLLRPRGTRGAVVQVLTDLTGYAPAIVEPWNTGDTGGWDTPGFAWDAAGAWGDLNLPWQMFVVAYRPDEILSGVSGISGWDCNGGGWDTTAFAFIDTATTREVPSDDDIYAAVADTISTGTVAWMRLAKAPAPPGSISPFAILSEAGAQLTTLDGQRLIWTPPPGLFLPDDTLISTDGTGLVAKDGTTLIFADPVKSTTVFSLPPDALVSDAIAGLASEDGAVLVLSTATGNATVASLPPDALVSDDNSGLVTEDGTFLTP